MMEVQQQQAWKDTELHSVPPVRSGEAGGAGEQTARAAHALAALRKAEQRTGATPVTTSVTPSTTTPVQDSAPQLAPRPALSVPTQLRSLLPGGLRRGSVVQITGSTALMLETIAAASTEELWTAIVGQPHIGILAAAETGVDLARLILVPQPGPDAILALSALLDGVDILVVGPEVALLPSDRRRLIARARERGTVIIATAVWPGAQIELSVTGVRWRGLGAGTGRLQSRELRVERAGRGSAAQWAQVEIVLPTGALPDDTTDEPEHIDTAHIDTFATTQAGSPLRLVG